MELSGWKLNGWEGLKGRFRTLPPPRWTLYGSVCCAPVDGVNDCQICSSILGWLGGWRRRHERSRGRSANEKRALVFFCVEPLYVTSTNVIGPSLDPKWRLRHDKKPPLTANRVKRSAQRWLAAVASLHTKNKKPAHVRNKSWSSFNCVSVVRF
ncbi:hypothetical protein GHT06_008039 [Daphnia sinensis]|uniref:Uncharacterized protein n=1 Tax=Daphnia sinensis TaxID=1820382 RepID=A0AAD5PY36_9CRUS|nr:hypothetical protein GHT06_008039 [Daphnia sinensis]